MIAWHGAPWRAVVQFIDREPYNTRTSGNLFTFANPAEQPTMGIQLTEQRSIDGRVIGVLAEFLGPVEAPAA